MENKRDDIKALLVLCAVVGIGVTLSFVHTGRAGGGDGVGCGGSMPGEEELAAGGSANFSPALKPKPTVVSPQAGHVYLAEPVEQSAVPLADVSISLKLPSEQNWQVTPTYTLWTLEEDETGLIQSFPYEGPPGWHLPPLTSAPNHSDLWSVKLSLPAGEYRVAAEVECLVTEEETVTSYRLSTRKVDFSVEADEVDTAANDTPVVAPTSPENG